MNRVYPPLKEDHPLVLENLACPEICPICKCRFFAGQRTTLLAPESREPSTVPVVVCHASCALKGVKFTLTNSENGSKSIFTISRIKDGDGSPFPVETDQGMQFTLEEAGLS